MTTTLSTPRRGVDRSACDSSARFVTGRPGMVNRRGANPYTVDTGHLVSFTADMAFQVRRIGEIKSTLFSDEGLVVDLTGPKQIMLQTRSSDAFLSWLIPRLPRGDGDEGRGFSLRFD